MDVAVRELTVEFESGGYVVRPLDRLDLEVGSGELVLLLGASGCGKTTLLSILAAILHPKRGSVRVGDVEVTELSGPALRDYRRATVGIVFQAFNLVPSLTACENVEMPLRGAGQRGRTSRTRARALLERVGLADRAGDRPGRLSGGQQQRVAIARALAHDPPVVLADEPTAHLDYVQVEEVLRLLRALAVPGRAVVVATHDERLLPLADRVVELSPRAARGSRPPERRTLAAGELVFAQGDPGDLVYVVEEGAIEVVRLRADGEEELVNIVALGRYFGELAPMFGLRRSASARAQRPSRVVGYTLPDFRAARPVDLRDLITASTS
jgi:putative ABC transport system ATP-binding protein